MPNHPLFPPFSGRIQRFPPCWLWWAQSIGVPAGRGRSKQAQVSLRRREAAKAKRKQLRGADYPSKESSDEDNGAVLNDPTPWSNVARSAPLSPPPSVYLPILLLMQSVPHSRLYPSHTGNLLLPPFQAHRPGNLSLNHQRHIVRAASLILPRSSHPPTRTKTLCSTLALPVSLDLRRELCSRHVPPSCFIVLAREELQAFLGSSFLLP